MGEEARYWLLSSFFEDQYMTKAKTEQKDAEGSSWSSESEEGQNSQYNSVSGVTVYPNCVLG